MKINYRKVSTLLLTGVIAGITMTSCKKKDDDPSSDGDGSSKSSVESKLIGSWDYGEVDGTYSYSTTIKFNSNNTFDETYEYCEQSQCNIEEYEGTWNLINDDTKIVFDYDDLTEPNDTVTIVSLTGSSLVVSDSDDDTTTFEKK